MSIGIPVEKLVIVLAALLVFGIIYNFFVAVLGSRQRGFTSLLVVFGVLVTLAGLAFLDPFAAMLTLLTFAFSGFPMVVGSIARYIIRREKDEKASKAQLNALLEVHNDRA